MPTYHKGHRTRPDILQHMRESAARHARHLKALPDVKATSYDCRTLGQVAPIKDQGQCGSCWDFSGTAIVESALYIAGVLKNDGNNVLSEQYTLDCGRNGGCNGDDASTVTDWAKKNGIPLTSEYGSYNAREGRCHQPSHLYTISDSGYCTPNIEQQGVARTQDIKNCMAVYGPISVAIAADDNFMNYRPGTIYRGDGNTGIDHDVVLVGWYTDPATGKTIWILRNSWGRSWGNDGYMDIEEGANLVGYSALWCSATPVPPPPGPNPPVPPGPAPLVVNIPAVTGSFFGLPVHVPGQTVPVVQATHALAGMASLTLPPWLLALLSQICAGAVPFPFGILCGLIPMAHEKAALGESVTIQVPSWVMPLLHFACSQSWAIAMMPANVQAVVKGLCQILPPETKAIPCGCK